MKDNANKSQAHWLGVYHADYRKLKNQHRFVKEIMDGDLVVNRKKKQAVVEELRDAKYEPFPKTSNNKKTKADEDEVDNEGEDDAEAGSDDDARDFDYLLSVCSIPQLSFLYEADTDVR